VSVVLCCVYGVCVCVCVCVFVFFVLCECVLFVRVCVCVCVFILMSAFFQTHTQRNDAHSCYH